MKKIKLTWKEFGDALEKLKKMIIDSGIKYKYVYGIPRGGVAIASYLSHHLNLIYIDSPKPYSVTKDLLIVDDIADTGNTLCDFAKYNIATIYKSNWTKIIPEFSVLKKEDKNSWIIFPWENKESEGGISDKMEKQTKITEWLK